MWITLDWNFFCGKPWEMKAGKSCAFCQDSLRNPWGMDLQDEENRRWVEKIDRKYRKH